MKDDKTVNDQVQVVDIQFRPGQKVYFFDPVNKTYQAGDHVIIDTARGPEYGICTAGNHMVAAKNVVAPLRPVLRLATAQDERAVEANRPGKSTRFRSAWSRSASRAWICSLPERNVPLTAAS